MQLRTPQRLLRDLLHVHVVPRDREGPVLEIPGGRHDPRPEGRSTLPRDDPRSGKPEARVGVDRGFPRATTLLRRVRELAEPRRPMTYDACGARFRASSRVFSSPSRTEVFAVKPSFSFACDTSAREWRMSPGRSGLPTVRIGRATISETMRTTSQANSPTIFVTAYGDFGSGRMDSTFGISGASP